MSLGLWENAAPFRVVQIGSRESQTAPYLDLVLKPSPLAVETVTASATSSGAPANTVDGDMSTAWAAMGDQSISWTLAQSAPVRSVSIDWWANSKRLTNFKLQSSVDRVTWSTLYEGSYAGPSGTQNLAFATAPTARYVRLIGYGAPDDKWTAVRDIRFYNYDITAPRAPAS
jgi:hypothetical protein